MRCRTLAQHVADLRRAPNARRRHRRGIDAPERHRGAAGAREHVQPEIARHLPACRSPPHAVAFGVELRREDADPEAPRDGRNDAAADAALGRHAHVVQPASRVVVHAAGRHHAQDFLGVAGGHRALACRRMHAVVGERRRHVREVAAVDQHRALTEVVLERRHRVAVDDPEVLEHPRDRAVAKTGLAFGAVDRFVDREVAPGKGGDGRGDAFPLRLDRVPADQARRRDCTRIDHRIERRTGLGIETDAVEGIAAGLDADFRLEEFATAVGRAPSRTRTALLMD